MKGFPPILFKDPSISSHSIRGNICDHRPWRVLSLKLFQVTDCYLFGDSPELGTPVTNTFSIKES